MNARAAAVVRYSDGVVNWTKKEMRKIDCKTRKQMTVRNIIYPQAAIIRIGGPRVKVIRTL